MGTFFESENSVSIITLLFAFLSMSLVTITTCIFKVKCRECILGCCKVTRDVSAENLELEIESRTNRRDIIPPSIV
jgi:hypothetical protein